MPDFRFRLPSITELTDTQQIAFYQPKPLLITGGPGSGKTVVSIFRYLSQIAKDQNAIFFTFNRTLMSAIRGTIRQKADLLLPELSSSQIEDLIENNIGSLFEWYGANFHALLSKDSDDQIARNFASFVENRFDIPFDEVFIDESQDLRPGIIKAGYLLASRMTCGADRSQDLQGHYAGPADDIIYDIMNTNQTTIRQELIQNFRNTKEIFEFARNFVPEDFNVQNIDTTDLPNGEAPETVANVSETEQLEIILRIIQEYPNNNIGILTHFKSQINKIKDFLEKNGYSCEKNAPPDKSFSYYYNQMGEVHKEIMENGLSTPFILTYDSCKGLEFDIVVMPFFESADWALKKYKPSKENPEYDANGNPKFWSTPNHYYVAATRARSQLFVLYDETPDILSFLSGNGRQNSLDLLSDLPF